VTAAATGALVRVAAVEQVPPGAVVDVEVDGLRLALVNQDGAVYAVQRDCTHAAGPLTGGELAADCLLQCPWHGAVFDVRTGRVRRGPARKPLHTYRVEVADGAVLVAMDAERSAGGAA
jgi:nitrite reductase/ring-hydroxylating ferredoxin subunit